MEEADASLKRVHVNEGRSKRESALIASRRYSGDTGIGLEQEGRSFKVLTCGAYPPVSLGKRSPYFVGKEACLSVNSSLS